MGASEASVPSNKEGKRLEGRLQGMVSMLSIQFLLGLALATVADYDPDTHTGNHAAHQVLLGLHVLVAVGILVGAVQMVLGTKKGAPRLSGLAIGGLVAVVVAFAAGAVRLSVDNEWLTFIMGVGFIAAVGIYGRLLGMVMARGHQ